MASLFEAFGLRNIKLHSALCLYVSVSHHNLLDKVHQESGQILQSQFKCYYMASQPGILINNKYYML